MPRVLVLDPLSPEGLKLLQAAPGLEYEERVGLEGPALREALAGADAAICRSGVKITAEALRDNRRLKAIARAGVGVDNIDLAAATRQGVVVMNTPSGNTLSTAEHTLTLMLALSRNIAAAHQSLVSGKWDRKKFTGTQLAGKTLGVIGLGRIGQAVAARAKALEMRVLGFDPYLSPDQARKLGVEPSGSVREMLPQVEYLTVHTPLTKETTNLIGLPELELLRPGVRLINCARGGIYNEEALAAGLKSGRIGGVALDVFVTEPCTGSPLFGLPNVLVTPHLGASTEEAQAQVAVEAVELIVDYLTRGAIRHAVNVSPIDATQLAGLRTFLEIAYRLGLLLSQWHRGVPKLCRLQYRGEVAEKNTKLITASFAAGLLENALADGVNIVNAEVLLRERGIELAAQSRSEMGDFRSLITAEVVTDQGTFTAAGTNFGQSMIRLVRLGEKRADSAPPARSPSPQPSAQRGDGEKGPAAAGGQSANSSGGDYRLESYLDGLMMIFSHRDVPGIIGKIGTICGKHSINIAQMAVGRATDTPGGDAIGVLNVDNGPSPAALEEIARSPDITSVRVIHLPAAGEAPAWMG